MQSWIHVIEWRANVRPELAALIDDRGTAYTYAQLRAEVERRAGGWAGLGVGPGDVVALVAKNSADFLVHAFALMRAGATPAFVNWRLSPRELTEVLTLVRPKAVAADAEFAALVDAALVDAAWPEPGARVIIGGGPVPTGALDGATLAGPVPPRPALTGETVLALVHTSGTTGRAKAIPLRHGALMMSVADFAIEIGDQVAGSRHLQILPLFHLGGFGQCLQAILTAGTVYIHTAFSPPAVIDAIETDRIEFFTAGPSLIDMLVAEIRARAGAGADLSSLREIAYGTAPITPSSLTAALAAFGCRFRQIYGNTESQSMISLLAPEDHQPGHPRLASAGRVSFGWEVRIVDPDGRDLPPEVPGELLIRGECLFSGYWRDPGATAAAFAEGGWYRTGDIASLTADGYLYILDRAKDMIISGGENIYPAEVEAVLARHPAGADVAVLGRPDPAWGEAVHAVIIPAPGQSPSAEDIVAWCRDQLAHFKCPKTVEFTTALPRTTTGKVLKRELRAQLTHPGQRATALLHPSQRGAGAAWTQERGTSDEGRPRLKRAPEAHSNTALSIASHSGLLPARIGALAGAAEQAGFSAVFVAEGHGDALSLCHPVAAGTSRVRLGTAITNAALRPPVLAAKTAAQLDQTSGGRFILGLGVANTVMNGRFGIAPFAPLPMIEEYVGVIRAVLRGDAAGYDGQVFRTGMVPLDSPPVRADLPVYLAALGPRMLELAGRIADGVILNLMTPAQAGQAASVVRAAARAAGRDPASVEIACVVHCCVSHDAAAAAAAARAIVLRYVMHPAAPRLFGEAGGDGGDVDLRGVRELVLAGDRTRAAGQVPQQVADGFVAHGGATQCAARLADYRSAGVDLPVLFPIPVEGDWGYEQTIAAMGSAALSTKPNGRREALR